ncbi:MULTISPECIES: hypothetical protein [unclassified Gilliamella]|nr:hypothetical protein [Gilliamella sp. B3801]
MQLLGAPTDFDSNGIFYFSVIDFDEWLNADLAFNLGKYLASIYV